MKYSISKTLLVSSLLVSGLSCAKAIADTDQIYLEEKGYVQFEAEDASIPADWVLGTGINGFRGNGYLEWTGQNYFSENNAGNGAIRYHFRIETAGNYELRWRSRIAKGDSNTESNDSWARFSTGSNVIGEEPLFGWTKVFMGEADVWSWSSRTVDQVSRPVRQFFTAGDHTVDISGRSNGHAIDRIALYRYPDMTFDSGLNGTLPLSLFIQEDGTIIDPNPTIDPTPVIVPEPVLSERVNVQLNTMNTDAMNVASCTANTLILPATNSATLSNSNLAAIYNTDELVILTEAQLVLLSFDLSLVPPFSKADLSYTTGLNISNGAVDIYLGSHSDWPDDNNANTPNAIVKIATAQGGWDAQTRYKSEMNASLLPRELTTLILSGQPGSDALELGKSPDGIATPKLIISGNNNFCSTWEASLMEQEQEQEPEPEPSNTTDNESAPVARKSKGGGVAYWFGLLLLMRLSLRPKSAIEKAE